MSLDYNFQKGLYSLGSQRKQYRWVGVAVILGPFPSPWSSQVQVVEAILQILKQNTPAREQMSRTYLSKFPEEALENHFVASMLLVGQVSAYLACLASIHPVFSKITALPSKLVFLYPIASGETLFLPLSSLCSAY